MDIKEFDYELPQELIAQTPAERRDHSRLLIVHRNAGSLEEGLFHQLSDLLNQGDVLVLNDTHVFPARLLGKKQPGGADIEMLLLNRRSNALWEVIAYRASRLKKGTHVVFSDQLYCTVADVLQEGKFLVEFSWQGDWDKVLAQCGQIPLPPYIHREDGEYAELDKERYQTIFAKPNQSFESAAAPTAGLHFSESLLQTLRQRGINIGYVTLQVGLDTFLPLRSERIEEHVIHSESYHLPPSTAELIESALARGKRVIAVGTTVVRVLESAAKSKGKPEPGTRNSNLFITPGFEFKIINGLITNFHLPRTTLLLLVSAFMGNDLRKKTYEYAIQHRFRFYSYGDAMLIL